MNNRKEQGITSFEWDELFDDMPSKKEVLSGEYESLMEFLREEASGKMVVMEPLNLEGVDECPICKNKIRVSYEDMMEHILLEQGLVCDRCGLNTMFAHGNTQIWIEDFHWSSHYTGKPKTQAHREREQQQLVLKLYRKMIVEGKDLTVEESAKLDKLAVSMEEPEVSGGEKRIISFKDLPA